MILNLNLVGRRKTLECFGRCGVYKMMTNLNMNSLDKLHTWRKRPVNIKETAGRGLDARKNEGLKRAFCAIFKNVRKRRDLSRYFAYRPSRGSSRCMLNLRVMNNLTCPLSENMVQGHNDLISTKISFSIKMRYFQPLILYNATKIHELLEPKGLFE